MLIPKEKPYLAGLNSYYLHIDKFVEHLQGEIGSGCLYCQSSDEELLVYFDERDIFRGVTQTNGEHAHVSESIEPVLQSLSQKNFQVMIYYLEPSAIFFWGQMPAFRRVKSVVRSTTISLQNLILRFEKTHFSGFVDVTLCNHDDGAILFFYQGECRVGSYSWGKGGGRFSEDDYKRLLGLLQGCEATYAIGQFEPETPSQSEVSPESTTNNYADEEYLSDLGTAIKEFVRIYIKVLRKKSKTEPVAHLKQKFLDCIDDYPVLDPFRKLYELNYDGVVEFADNVPREEIVTGIVECVWKVIEDNKLQTKFRVAVNKWDYKVALEERGIVVDH